MVLPFAKLAMQHFGFLETDYGFRRVNTDDRLVRWESTDVFVQVHFDATRSYEVGAEIGQLNVLFNGNERPFDIGEVARLAGIPWSQYKVFQASNEERLDAVLKEMADLLRQAGQALLRNDTRAFAALGKLREQECAAYAEERDLRQMRDAADKAWHQRDYRAVVALYGPHTNRLSPAEIKRYELALKQTAGAAGTSP